MSIKMTWDKSYQSNEEGAITLVRLCIAALRSRGLKTDTALRDLPGILGISPRRVRTLFHRDYEPVVLKNEWLSLRYRVGLFFLNEAQRLRLLADDFDEAGETLVAEQMELPWEAEWQSTSGSQKRSGSRLA